MRQLIRGFGVRNQDQTKLLRHDYGMRQCLRHSFCLPHGEFGLLHVRRQTWLPFSLHVWTSGREWLARPFHRAGILRNDIIRP